MTLSHDEPDDTPLPEPIIVGRECWWCRQKFWAPEDEFPRCCSDACDLAYCKKSQEDMYDAYDEIYAHAPPPGCAWCGQPMPSFRVDHVCESCRKDEEHRLFLEKEYLHEEERVELTDEEDW